MGWLTDIKKLFKEHKPKFHISTDETDYKQLYEQQKHHADTLQHSIMQIRNDLIMEDKVSNNDMIDRLNNLLGVSEHD